VSERAARIEAWTELSPVRFLGTIPADNPPEEAIAQVKTAEAADEPGALEGQAASAGRASGPARVVITPAQFGKVKQGDVLVCRSTSPTWTPLFNIVSALVSEAGGVLSHPAIIAREHGLPAVVGVSGATSLIVDGQYVEVDGDSGVVRIPALGANRGNCG
jgi:pyruvate,water dikinase